MTAITPNAPNHDNLEPLSSRFVDVEALPWEPTEFPGVEAKTLLVDDYVWRPAGSRHEAWSPRGGLMLAVFVKPNRFFREGGATTDMLGRDYDETWGDG
jgi:hypothetical protein